MMIDSDTIVAVATGAGGALAVVRISGKDALAICDRVFVSPKGKKLVDAKGYTLHYGYVVDRQRADSTVVDDVVVSVYRSPRSYTGEDMVEISCHGSRYIQQEIVKLIISNGARHAEAGEFTVRAFLNGKIDLSQAEAVADMIASTDRATHSMAATQMRGGYSAEFSVLREQLLNLASLLELELDFSEEDVEFADRTQIEQLLVRIGDRVNALLSSFSVGSAIKEGVCVAIVGNPNVGKSTLLNSLLKDDRAMVSDIAGTTRDVIEEVLTIDGVKFRFLDTAGIRQTADRLEQMGIERTHASIKRAAVVMLLVEADGDLGNLARSIESLLGDVALNHEQRLCVVINKCDRIGVGGREFDTLAVSEEVGRLRPEFEADIIAISAKQGDNTDALLDYLSGIIDTQSVYNGETIVSNSRHYEALVNAGSSLSRALAGLKDGISSDLLAQDIRESLHHLGTITGEITNNDILQNIFSKFCIGK